MQIISCRHCGEPLVGVAKFCPQCGGLLADDETVMSLGLAQAGSFSWKWAGAALAALVVVVLTAGLLSVRSARPPSPRQLGVGPYAAAPLAAPAPPAHVGTVIQGGTSTGNHRDTGVGEPILPALGTPAQGPDAVGMPVLPRVTRWAPRRISVQDEIPSVWMVQAPRPEILPLPMLPPPPPAAAPPSSPPPAPPFAQDWPAAEAPPSEMVAQSPAGESEPPPLSSVLPPNPSPPQLSWVPNYYAPAYPTAYQFLAPPATFRPGFWSSPPVFVAPGVAVYPYPRYGSPFGGFPRW
ncbi:MAG: zinc ribbon domain-containing protein [Armatimonadetes bacterium]|nr:zinc ribbon domain-containing protein [Armatimonadota bacterium]